MEFHKKDGVFLYRGDALSWYDKWEVPVVIVSDGPLWSWELSGRSSYFRAIS